LKSSDKFRAGLQTFDGPVKNSAELQSYLNQAMTAEEHTYASHPTLRTRIAGAPQQTKVHTAMGIGFYQEFAADEAKLFTSVGDLMCYLYGSGETAHGAEEAATS
jgi:hypothetical protein